MLLPFIILNYYFCEELKYQLKYNTSCANFIDLMPTESFSVYTSTVNSLNIRTPKKFVVITLKFELCGSTIE